MWIVKEVSLLIIFLKYLYLGKGSQGSANSDKLAKKSVWNKFIF